MALSSTCDPNPAMALSSTCNPNPAMALSSTCNPNPAMVLSVRASGVWDTAQEHGLTPRHTLLQCIPSVCLQVEFIYEPSQEGSAMNLTLER